MNKKLAVSLVIFTLFATVSAGWQRAKYDREHGGRDQPTERDARNVFGKKRFDRMSFNQQERALKALALASPKEVCATIDRRKKK